MMAAYGTLQACTVPIFLITDGHDVDIQGEPTTAEWVILAILGITPLLMVAVGWLVSRWPSHSRQRAATATSAAAVAILVTIVKSERVADLPSSVVVVSAIPILTASGLGSVLGWAMRMTLSHLATVGALAVRALPVVLLTALVFFNTYVWIMAATITGERLWLAIMFLAGIASAFVVSATLDRVKPMLKSTAALPRDAERLADTPFAAMPDASPSPPLTRAERLNVVFVMATSQLVQIGVVAVVTATIYLGLGLIVLSPALLNEWAHTAVSSVTLLGMTLPAPGSLIHMCLFLGALTFMYISARAVGDTEYRTTFLDPLMDDLRTTLIARNRYRGEHPDRSNLSGKRYGEVLLVTLGEAGPQATVYNSFPLNDCPAELWSALDAAAIAAENGAATALLNGPRYWLMNSIEKEPQGPLVTKTFGGIEMLQQATVLLSSMNPAPYTVNQVSRNTVFVFHAGEEIYELIDPDGQRWVMQTWSQVRDPNLSRADLPGLGERLTLPAGWSYHPRVLTNELRIDTTTRAARVLQDDLTNSYSLVTA